MLWIEIPLRKDPVIYHSEKMLGLIPRDARRKSYKFSSKPHALQLIRKYQFDIGFERGQYIYNMLLHCRDSDIPRIAWVQRKNARRIVRDWLKIEPTEQQQEDFTTDQFEAYGGDYDD